MERGVCEKAITAACIAANERNMGFMHSPLTYDNGRFSFLFSLFFALVGPGTLASGMQAGIDMYRCWLGERALAVRCRGGRPRSGKRNGACAGVGRDAKIPNPGIDYQRGYGEIRHGGEGDVR